MATKGGRNIPLSLPRRLLADMMHLGRQFPTVAVERRMNLGPLAVARQACAPRPGWCALFTKAFAVVAARRPELRRSYIPLPRAHLYEHDCNIAAILMERRYGEEDAAARVDVRQPERYGLSDLDARLRRQKDQPVQALRVYRRYRRLALVPGPLRRLLLWLSISVSGRFRARSFGTFEVTTTAGAGADVLHAVTVMPIVLTYGVVDETGSVNVRLMFDHRIFDGGVAGRAVRELNDVLLTDILAELHSLKGLEAA